MISNHVINQQKFVLFVDNVGMERNSETILRELLKQQGQEPIEAIPSSLPYQLDTRLCDMSMETVQLPAKTNVILPALSKLLNVYTTKSIFQFVNNLRKDSNVKQIFLWASNRNISESFVVPFMEYLADLIVTLVDPKHLTIVTRKSGGSVTNKYYQYQLGNGDFNVKELKKIAQKQEEPEVKPETSFKIDLEEEEMVARNALKLPYERTNDIEEGQILYTPDADDDFDEEDPDDDLCI